MTQHGHAAASQSQGRPVPFVHPSKVTRGAAGRSQAASAQAEHADAVDAADSSEPLIISTPEHHRTLPGRPQEAADASSGQTQQRLKPSPQRCTRRDRQRGAGVEGVQAPNAAVQTKPNSACCVGGQAAQPDAQRRPANAARGNVAGAAEA